MTRALLERQLTEIQEDMLVMGGMVETATGRRVSYLLSVHADLVFDDALHVFRSIEAVLVGDAALARRVSQGAWEAKTRTLKGRSQKVLQPRIQAALDAFGTAVLQAEGAVTGLAGDRRSWPAVLDAVLRIEHAFADLARTLEEE